MRTLKINQVGFIYMLCIICSLLIDQTAIVGGIVPGRTRYIFNAIIILFACLPLFHGIIFYRRVTIKRVYGYYLLTCIVPYIAIMVLSFIINIWAKEPIYSEIITTTLYWLIPVLTMYSAVYLLGEKAVDYTFYALAINYSLNLCVSLIRQDARILETHTVTLSLGMIVLYYLLFDKKKGNRFKLILASIFFLLGFKRIAIIAIPISIITFILINKRQNKVKIIINMLAVFTFAVAFIYIYIIRSGVLNVLVYKYNINTMSRIQTYNYFNNYFSLSPNYWGTGVGFVMKELKTVGEELYGIGDLHNDILKMYIELGFFGFLAFFINMIIFQTNRLIRVYYKVGIIYFTLLVYTLILCFTDNILRYNAYLIIFYMIPLVSWLKLKGSE